MSKNKLRASEAHTETSDTSKSIQVEVLEIVTIEPGVQPDPAAIATAAGFIEQGAKFETQLFKHVISSAAIMCAQGREFGKAKKVLRNSGADEKVTQGVLDELYVKSGLAPSTMNRRIQMWDEAVYRDIIDLELQLKIEKSPTFTPELLTELGARIGSITGTQFMRQIGMLPDKDKKSKATKTGKSLKEKLDEKSAQVEALLVEIKMLLADKELGKGVEDKSALAGLHAGYAQMEISVSKFKSLAVDLTIHQLPDFEAPAIRDFDSTTVPDLGIGKLPGTAKGPGCSRPGRQGVRSGCNYKPDAPGSPEGIP